VSITLEHIQRALTLRAFDPSPSMLAMAPMGRPGRKTDPPPREAGVLMLFCPLTPQPPLPFEREEAQNGSVIREGGQNPELHIILTRRTDQLNGHSGQMSFPGGRRDPDDADFWQTALRETREELGIDTIGVECLGSLTSLYIPPSHFDVYPWAGYLRVVPSLNPNPYEVASVHFAPVSALFDPANKHELDLPMFTGQTRRVPAYLLCGQVVWGATAIMLSELEHRLRAVL